MPVEFLSDAEAAAYGRFDGSLTREDLHRAFFLDDADRELIGKRRGAPNRLGFALQLTTARWLGTFLPYPTDVPPAVLQYVAGQLEVEDPSVAPARATVAGIYTLSGWGGAPSDFRADGPRTTPASSALTPAWTNCSRHFAIDVSEHLLRRAASATQPPL